MKVAKELAKHVLLFRSQFIPAGLFASRFDIAFLETIMDIGFQPIPGHNKCSVVTTTTAIFFFFVLLRAITPWCPPWDLLAIRNHHRFGCQLTVVANQERSIYSGPRPCIRQYLVYDPGCLHYPAGDHFRCQQSTVLGAPSW